MNDGLQYPGSDGHTDLCPTPTSVVGLFDSPLFTNYVRPTNNSGKDNLDSLGGQLAQLQAIAVSSKLVDLLPH